MGGMVLIGRLSSQVFRTSQVTEKRMLREVAAELLVLVEADNTDRH